jgi:hypothetical protein
VQPADDDRLFPVIGLQLAGIVAIMAEYEGEHAREL